jgi:hypothetical protein
MVQGGFSMEIQSIGNGSLVIYLTGDELHELPASPYELTTGDAADILRSALGSSYDSSWDSVCFELFPGNDSLLLFARQHSGSPSFFSFNSIEPLIEASRECPPGLISYLTYSGDTYILIVYPWNGERPPSALFEFGDELFRPAHYSLHLSEHSSVLAGPTALDLIRDTF